MSSPLAHAYLRQDEAYSIELSPSAKRVLAALPSESRMAIVRRLAEIAHVATALRSWMANEIKSSMHFEISGYAISYVMSDAHRTLSVLSVVPASAQ